MKQLGVLGTIWLLAALLQAASAGSIDAVGIWTASEHQSQRIRWPGYEPGRIPAAIFDGSHTWLFCHPQPPNGFLPRPDMPGVYIHPGLHPAIRANTSIELNGVQTATIMPSLPRSAGAGETETNRLAGVLLHEKFHVFQHHRHPDWGANEAALFVYPATDGELLGWRRLETDALRRALAAASADEARRWAAAALDWRARRYGRLAGEFQTYERETERVEGTAFYVESVVTGRTTTSSGDNAEYTPRDVRRWCYTTGNWLARLLDRFDPGWKDALEAGSFAYLDDRLRQVTPDSIAAAEFDDATASRCLKQALQDAADLRRERERLLEDYLSQTGGRLILISEQPLWPAGFDPMNVDTLTATEVLHRRWLKLKNDNGSLEILDGRVLTEGAGPHPLFNGVRRVTLTGLTGAPRVEVRDGRTLLEWGPLKGDFASASVERAGRTVILQMLPH